MITAYDSLTAQIATGAGVDIILVGDSVATVCLGYQHTSELSFDEFKYHVASVLRNSLGTPVIADITYDVTQSEQALVDAAQALIALGCVAVKIEFAKTAIEQAQALTSNQIPVVGHIGITPQTIEKNQKIKALGQSNEEVMTLLKTAKDFEAAGCCMLVVECVVAEVVLKIKQSVKIPIIGIGSGIHCDGQVLVFHDVIGWNNGFKAKFSMTFRDCQEQIQQAVREYVASVHSSNFPTDQHSYHQIRT